MLRDERFLRENFKNIYTRLSTIVNKSAKYFPTMGMFCPQPGNDSFPTWEIGFVASFIEKHLAPLMGMLKDTFAKNS